MKNKKAATNRKNLNDDECFKYEIIITLNRNEVQKHPERVFSNFLEDVYLQGIKFRTDQKDWNKFKQKNKNFVLNLFPTDKFEVKQKSSNKMNSRDKTSIYPKIYLLS